MHRPQPNPTRRRGASERSVLALAAVLVTLPLTTRALATPGQAEGPGPLPGTEAGQPQRGQAIVLNRQLGLCTLCHSGPFPLGTPQGNLGPPLDGVGARLSAAQLRQKLINPLRDQPDSLMPAYHRTDHLQQVGSRWQGQPLLNAQQIEDVVAYLASLQP